MDEPLLTPQDVADLLKISLHTLASWRRQAQQHDLPWIEVGGSIRYRSTDVQGWLDKRTLGGTLQA
jgi:excisionase family DNA binding protein